MDGYRVRIVKIFHADYVEAIVALPAILDFIAGIIDGNVDYIVYNVACVHAIIIFWQKLFCVLYSFKLKSCSLFIISNNYMKIMKKRNKSKYVI